MVDVQLKTMPILRITDVAVAKQFYGGFLGFMVDWEHDSAEGAPVYMQVSRGELVLHLSENERFRKGTMVYLSTVGIERLHGELSRRHQPWSRPVLSPTPWEPQQMEIEDPFGNVLRFNEDKPSRS